MAENTADSGLALRDIVLDASKLKEKRRELETLRQDHVREWVQNREFYKGNQWIFWNRAANRVESIGVDDGDKPRYKVRLTANQITPNTQQLVAQMTKVRPTIRAVPNTSSDRDVKSAQMAEALYESLWVDLGLAAKLKSALTHAQLSAGYWLITWDPFAGRPFKVTMSPDGQVITDDLLADIFREELQEQGVDPQMFEKQLYLGEVSVQVVPGEQVWLDPVATSFEDCAFAICRYPMSVDEIKSRFGADVTPDTTTGDMRPQLQFTQGPKQRPKNARLVYHGYFRPTPSLPKGRYVCWIEEPDQILYQSDWEFPFTELPLVKFPGIENPEGVYDLARGTLARPLQKELNNKISKVAMHMNLTMKPQMLAPVGSLRQRLTDEPGAVLEYSIPAGMQPPQWRELPPIPGHVQWYLADVQQRLDRVYNIMPSERSSLPARTDSGQLVELVQEAVADQISPEIQRMEDSLARAGKLIASLAQANYQEPRLIRMYGPGGSIQAKRFLASDIDGGFDFKADAASGLPHTRAGRFQQIKEMVEMGVLDPQEAIPYLPITGLRSVQDKVQADEEYALRKIEKLIEGEPLNAVAATHAMQALQQGVNPMTGQPLDGTEDVQAILTDAALTPPINENLQVSMSVLRTHMAGAEFERYPVEVQDRFQQHYMKLIQTFMSLPRMDSPIKTTLRLAGTVGPTVGSEILRQQGIMSADPQTMTEKPLDTMVYDSLDKPNESDSGNDPMTQMQALQAMVQAQDEHTAKVQRANADAALAQHRVARAAQDASNAQEAHDSQMAAQRQQVSHAHAQHQARLRQVAARKPAGG